MKAAEEMFHWTLRLSDWGDRGGILKGITKDITLISFVL